MRIYMCMHKYIGSSWDSNLGPLRAPYHHSTDYRRSRENIVCRVVVGRRLTGRMYRVAGRRAQLVYEDTERAFTERSKSLLPNAPNPRKW